MDTSLLRTVCFVPGDQKKALTFQPAYHRHPVIRTFSMGPSVSLLTGFDCTMITWGQGERGGEGG